MKRRNRNADDGLELFLDTICNTFGGIIFLAILLAIITQTKSLVESSGTSEVPSTAAEVRELQQRMDEVEASIASLNSALSEMPEVEVSDDLAEFFEKDMQLKEFQAEIQQLRQDSESAKEKITALLEENAELTEENEAIPAKLRSLREDVQERADEISSVIQEKETLLRLPRETVTSKSSSLVLLQQGRAYIAGQYNSLLNRMDGPHVETEDIAGGKVISPKRGSGVLVGDRALRDLLRTTKQRGMIITLAVWPDSYEIFASLKQNLVDIDLKYQIWVQRPGEELEISIGTGNSRAQ